MLQSAASPSTRSTRVGYSRARQGLIGRITPSTSCYDIGNSLRSDVETFTCRSGRDDTGTVMRGLMVGDYAQHWPDYTAFKQTDPGAS